MNRFRNPLAGVFHHAGPDSKYVGIRGFLDALTTDPQALPDACERRNNDGTGYPCE